MIKSLMNSMSPTRPRSPKWLAIMAAFIALGLSIMHPSFQMAPSDKLLNLFEEVGKYFLFAILFFVVFWVALGRLLAHRKISRRPWPKRAQVINETVFSLSSQVIALAVGLWIADYLWPTRQIELMYNDIGEYGIAYYGLTVFLTFFIHDTFFYWAHRLMHQPWMFKWIHKTHHESTDPTPFTTFHFHPVEAVLEALGGWCVVLILLLMPWHESVPAVWALGMIIFNSIGHLGFEVYPSWWLKVPVLSGKTTALHHYMHHQRVRGNYALYFRFWDRVCGTEFVDYEKRYAQIFKRGV